MTTSTPSPAGASDERAAMSPSVADCIEAAARFLAGQPAAVQRALATHRCRPDGRCTACGHMTHWPCVTVSSARRALDLLDDHAGQARSRAT